MSNENELFWEYVNLLLVVGGAKPIDLNAEPPEMPRVEWEALPEYPNREAWSKHEPMKMVRDTVKEGHGLVWAWNENDEGYTLYGRRLV